MYLSSRIILSILWIRQITTLHRMHIASWFHSVITIAQKSFFVEYRLSFQEIFSFNIIKYVNNKDESQFWLGLDSFK